MNRISNALNFIPADERSTWVQMAMAVKSELGDSGFQIWDDWSQTASNYNSQAARSVWRSCKGTGITIATLLHEAKINGLKDDQRYTPPTREQIEAQRIAVLERQSKEGRERMESARQAAKKANWILGQCKQEKHAYLFNKGFPDMVGLVWRPEQDSNILCVPMYVAHDLVGVQMIDKFGSKKFLSGQITSKAEFCINSGLMGATHYWTEGYATGLSLRECLHALKRHYLIHITFSAGNLKRMAHSGICIADNDESRTGEDAAIATGLPYWMPPTVGTDFNDFQKQLGTFRASQVLRKWLQEQKEAEEWLTG